MPSDHPQTPQSPSQTSPGTHEPPFKLSNSPRTSDSLPTPAHSINGSMSSMGSGFAAEVAQLEELSHKRKRDVDDHGDREQKKVHVEAIGPSIEDLHLDVGKKYLLCRTPHSIGKVDMTTDLFERYDLESIAASVARTGENGEKKKVRKTYKNYMRNLTGAFDVEKKDEGSPDTMLFMMQLPQEEWDATTGRAARVEKGLTDEASANLGKAMTMTRGGIPRSMWNPNVLGELTSTTAAAPTKATIGGVKRPMQAMQTAPGARVIKEEAARPKRNKKPRKYGDETFEGYGEGFVDDDLQDGAYSGGDGEDGSGARKRFKKNPTAPRFQGPPRQNSYGPGMVGA